MCSKCQSRKWNCLSGKDQQIKAYYNSLSNKNPQESEVLSINWSEIKKNVYPSIYHPSTLYIVWKG